MEKICVLGTAGAVTNAERDNVSLAYTSEDFHLLLECGGSAAHKLARLSIPYQHLEHIIITHTHLDHYYGLPGLIFSMRYHDQPRTTPLHIYCPQGAVGEIQALFDLLTLQDSRFFPIEIHGVPPNEQALVLTNQHVTVTSTPVDHSPDLPTYAIKIVSHHSGKTIVYSSDTGPSERLIRLAADADLLLHECAGLSKHPIPAIHSNALQVGQIAQRSQVKRLILLHLDSALPDAPADILAEIRTHFTGAASIASDFDEYGLSA
jgi:ribonuclease Z